MINPAISGVENGHLGQHHHHNMDYVTTELVGCENPDQPEPKDCDDQIYYQHNLDICDPEEPENPNDPEDPEDPNQPEEDDPQVLGDNTPEIKGDLARTGDSTVALSLVSSVVLMSAMASINMSRPSKEELLNQIAL